MLFPVRSLAPVGGGRGVRSSLYSGLVSYWKLDEASGTRNDSKGTNHLTANATVAQVAGQFGNAAGSFSAGGSWLSVSAGTAATGSAMSLSFWLYQNTVAGTNYFGIINKDIYSSNRSWAIETNENTGDIKFYFALTTTDIGVHFGKTAALTLSAAAWHHIVWVFDGSQSTNATRLFCYVNGVAKTLTFSGSAVPSSLPAATANIEFGRQTFGRYLSGRLDDVALYNRALTAGEAAGLTLVALY